MWHNGDLAEAAKLSRWSQRVEGFTHNHVRLLNAVSRQNGHLRYLKEMRTYGSIFGTKEGKDKALRQMELLELALLVRIIGQLLQTKVYLFWHSMIRN